MCGIAGIYFTEGTPPEGRRTIERMTTTLVHRGPDDCGYHVDEQVVLGHRRLSIIDVSGGQQPIYNEDQTICVVFNGEIYNFREVRARLIADGHMFRTNSDTETIVHAYEAWGDQCVEHFHGMFAFAIRDRRRDRVLLARDRFGKKPLFYASYAGKFVFASEMKAILADPLFQRRLDEEALASYFMLSYVPAPLTIFRGIRKLLPGHILTIDQGRIQERRYWKIAFKPDHRRSEKDFIEEFTHRMGNAVSTRLMSEVPLGAFLSGGIDSSAVVAFMARASETPVKTFTIGFPGDTRGFDDERKYARMVAERYKTDHHEYEVRPHVTDVIEAIVRSFDEPFADDSMIPSYFVCKAAREKVTVALSGLGGDEAFCGYERYLGFHLSQFFNRLPGALRSRVVLPLVNALPEQSGSRVNHLKRFVRASAEDDARRYLGFMMKIAPNYRRGLFSPNAHVHTETIRAVEDRFLAHYADADAETPLDRVFSWDVHTYLSDDILTLTDRLSMCHSLEVRVPFLDHELFEFSATIPAGMKLKWLRKKYLLKKALVDRLPRPVLTHRKQGFVGPMSQWLRGELKEYTRDVLSSERLSRHGLLDEGTVARVLSDHFDGRETNDTLIWALVVFQVWYEQYLDNPVPAPLAAARA